MPLAQLTHISVLLQLAVADSQSQPFTIAGLQPNKGQPERSLEGRQKSPFVMQHESLDWCKSVDLQESNLLVPHVTMKKYNELSTITIINNAE